MEIDIIEQHFRWLELHVPDSDRELPKLFGKQIKANGGNYNECRGHQSDRFVKVRLDRPGGLGLAEAILARKSATCVIMRDPRSFDAGHRRLYLLDFSPGKHEHSHEARSAYRSVHAAGRDEVCLFNKVLGPYRDLQRPAMRLAKMIEDARECREHNIIAHGISGAVFACRAFSQGLVAHLKAHEATGNALSVALDRIELRVLKGELAPLSEPLTQELLAA